MTSPERSAWAWPARSPRSALLVAGIVTAVAAAGALRVRFRSDLAELVPKAVRSAPALRRWQRLFAAAEPVAALVEGEDPAAVAASAERLVAAARRLPSVRDATDVVDPGAASRIRPAETYRHLDGAGFARASEALSPAAIDAAVRRARAMLLQPGAAGMAGTIREDPLGLRALLGTAYGRIAAGVAADPATGRLVSPDGRFAVVLVRPESSPFEGRGVARQVARLERSGARAAAPGVRVRWTGPHVVARDTERMIRGDLARSSAISLGGIVLVLLLAFGRLRAALLLALPLALGALWTAGIAGLALAGLSAVSVGFAAVVLGLGDDASVHLLSAATAARREGRGPREAASLALEEVGRPAAVAAATAALAFLALATSSFRALRELGILAAVGVVATFGVAWLVLGPVLARSERPVAFRAGLLEDTLARLGEWVFERRTAIVVLGAAVVVGAVLLGLPPFAERALAVRPSRLPSLRTQADLFRIFGGSPGQWVALRESGTLDGALETSDALAAALARLERRGLVEGFDSLSTLHPSPRTQRDRLSRWRALPLADAAARLQAALAAGGFARAPFEEAIRDLRQPPEAAVRPPGDDLFVRRHLARAGNRFVTATYVRPPQDLAPARLARALRRAGAAPTGWPLLEHEVRALLPRDLARTGAVALVLVVLVLAVHFRRVRPVLVSAAGLLVGLAALALAVRVAGIRWTAYNLVVLPVLVGISVDENLFLVERWLRAPGEAVHRAVAATSGAGRAILTTSATTLVGFGALLACDFDGLRDLGLTAAIGVAACAASSLLVTPALAGILLISGSAGPRTGSPRSAWTRARGSGASPSSASPG